MTGDPTDIELVPVSREAADAVLGGGSPAGFDVPDDYPSEFSAGIADSVGKEGMVGPFFIRRLADGVVVGEIGGAFTDASTVEIGYAVVDSQAGRGYATAAVLKLAGAALRLAPKARRLVAHTPLDRPASGKVLAKAGFEDRGEALDEHEGVPLTVKEWVLPLGGAGTTIGFRRPD